MTVKKFNPQGLTLSEATLRLQKFGYNELKPPKTFTSLRILFDQFKSPLIYILVLAGIVTIFLKDFTDTVVIFAAVFLNTALGFYQEKKAQKSLEALKSLLAAKAKVIRDGSQRVIEARKVVPGDLVVLAIGDRVPADGVLVEATDLTVNEAILTGESVPVEKKSKFNSPAGGQKSKVFMGTTVVTGIGKMLVEKTGRETKVGKIGKRITEIEEEKTPLQIEIGKLAKILAIGVGVVAFLIFLLGEFLGYQFLEMFTTSVAVAVAAIPEGLAVSLTVILAVGTQRILKRKAIVRKLLAAETLGSVSVICADKTGTLTEGKMKVIEAITEEAELRQSEGGMVATSSEMLVKAAVLCNDLRDPLEVAMREWGKEKLKVKSEKLKVKDLKRQYPRLDEIPFNPTYKYIATLHEVPREDKVPQVPQEELKARGALLFLSGAPEVVLKRCKIYDLRFKNKWFKKFEELGQKGYRLVGFGYKIINHKSLIISQSDINGLEWLGLLVFEDPIRQGVKEALKECQRAGIKVKVITGDYLPTAMAVLEKLKVKSEKLKVDEVMTGEELEKISDEELKKRVGNIALFARTDPEQKLKIVQALKANDEVVAMMGDGVNDALALKQADIGIVVNEASDVARESSDMVLLDSNFATIVHAVEEGRVMFENIRKVALYLLSSSFTEVILIGGSLLLSLPLPVTAAQILWVNLIEDSLPGVALAFEPKEDELMLEPPRERGTPILNSELKVLIFIIGIFSDLFLFFLFFLALKGFLHLHFLQTFMFVALGIDSLFYIFACRSFRRTIFQRNPLENRLLIFSVLFGFFFLVAGVYFPPLQILLKTHPLDLKEWFLLFTLGLFDFLLIELTKWLFMVKKREVNK